VFKPYKYTKEEPSLKHIEEASENIVIRLPKPKLSTVEIRQWGSAVLVVSGLFLIAQQIILPWIKTPAVQTPLLKPNAPSVAGARSKGIEVGFEFAELQQEHKSIKALKQENTPNVFYLTIPKLGIERAEVETNSKNLSPDERLGHYLGSALPGEVGNTFIYGHSASPMFFNPRDYKTIFTTLEELKKGDQFTVKFGEKQLKYVVEKSVVLDPADVQPLETISPSFLRKSYLTLMTCVPPGIKTKRLLVQARLVP